ncbi:hypothetical protein BKE30_03020 [Alkanindiges hydrocarboniclasticus]|uniref:Uncharacterized protein n=1 Tax=Alkanindiges hydrocarboniclasticus TaxID=1907941 RepID=A0A1S8CWU8_9GAMM|nr:hypothetical protein BKE30_03020 [Alkanindiges hydrocarboniclasticus]
MYQVSFVKCFNCYLYFLNVKRLDQASRVHFTLSAMLLYFLDGFFFYSFYKNNLLHLPSSHQVAKQ